MTTMSPGQILKAMDRATSLPMDLKITPGMDPDEAFRLHWAFDVDALQYRRWVAIPTGCGDGSIMRSIYHNGRIIEEEVRTNAVYNDVHKG